MDEDFILTVLALDELSELGYSEVWIGAVSNPHWDHHGESFVIASPKRTRGGWPALWNAKKLGEKSCGNGLQEADQSQANLVRRMISGHYKLADGSWEKMET